MLARETRASLTIIGAGVQGEHHLRTFPLVRDFDEIRICSLYAEDAHRLAALHPRAHAVDDPAAAVRGADVVALATHAAQPVIEPGWIAPGTHVSSVGYRPPDGELPRALLDNLFVETREAFEPTAGRLRRTRRAATRRAPPRSARSCWAAGPAAPATTRSPSTRRWATSSRTSSPPSSSCELPANGVRVATHFFDRLASVPVKSLPVQMTPTRPTLATVAEALGVSRMTVSNAFNRPDQLSPELRERVLAKAHELGYGGPNPVARTLSRGRTGSVGVVLDAPLTLAFSDPAAVQVLHGVATVCEERELGMSLVPRIPGHDAALVRTALVDGFVVYCMGDSDPRLDAIIERRLPYALIDHSPDSADLTVNIDDRGAAHATVEHLIALGHRRFGIVRGWDNPLAASPPPRCTTTSTANVCAAGATAIEAAGIEWDEVVFASAPDFDMETGRIAGGHLLDRANRPTAIVCVSDVLALGVMQAAADRGVPFRKHCP